MKIDDKSMDYEEWSYLSVEWTGWRVGWGDWVSGRREGGGTGIGMYKRLFEKK